MPEIVVDASLASAWCFPDEQTDYTVGVLTAVTESANACAPRLFSYEIYNSVLMGIRRSRIASTHAEKFFMSLNDLNFQLTDTPAYNVIFKLASNTGLTFYDASYLDLALRKNAPLASLDNAMKQAATKMGITLFQI